MQICDLGDMNACVAMQVAYQNVLPVLHRIQSCDSFLLDELAHVQANVFMWLQLISKVGGRCGHLMCTAAYIGLYCVEFADWLYFGIIIKQEKQFERR